MLCVNTYRVITNEEWFNILEELEVYDKLKKARKVVIKPNFAAGAHIDPKTHVMTDQQLLGAVIELTHQTNPEALIYIAESDSTGYGFAFLKFEHLGLPDSLGVSEGAAQKIRLLDLSRDRLERVENVKFRRYINVDSQLWLSTTLLHADFVIDLSNLKTHTVTGYTGACKNLFGCLPDFEKYHNHPFIHQTIHDLVLAINPDLNVVDAFYGMERNGPVQGIDVDTGYRIISNNAFEADVYAATTIGYAPDKIKYLRLLAKSCDYNFSNEAQLVKEYQKADYFVRVMNAIGLWIQRVGLAIEHFGHRIHTCNDIVSLIITVVRPILLKVFDYEKLKQWKHKILK